MRTTQGDSQTHVITASNMKTCADCSTCACKGYWLIYDGVLQAGKLCTAAVVDDSSGLQATWLQLSPFSLGVAVPQAVTIDVSSAAAEATAPPPPPQPSQDTRALDDRIMLLTAESTAADERWRQLCLCVLSILGLSSPIDLGI